MKNKFVLKTIFFFITFVLVNVFFILLKNNGKLEFFKIHSNNFKISLTMLQNKMSVLNKTNLILGSSMARNSINIDDFPSNWIKFTKAYQNIYESNLLLKYVNDKISVDTVLIVVNPFDFVESHEKSLIKNGNFGLLNGNQKEQKFFFIENFQLFLNNNFMQIEYIFRKYIGRNLQSAEPEFHDLYFTNVTPNFKYFDMYHNYSNSNKIKTIYIISPKNKKYLENLNENLWLKIKHGMIKRGIELWDFEDIYIENSDYFINATHLTEQASTDFTHIILNKVYNKNSSKKN